MTAVLLGLVISATLGAAQPNCEAIDAHANEVGARILGNQAVYEVMGRGRLQFYSAPSKACAIPGVFVVPSDHLIAYVEYGSYTAVMFINSKEGGETQGWVLSERLRATGKGISPK